MKYNILLNNRHTRMESIVSKAIDILVDNKEVLSEKSFVGNAMMELHENYTFLDQIKHIVAARYYNIMQYWTNDENIQINADEFGQIMGEIMSEKDFDKSIELLRKYNQDSVRIFNELTNNIDFNTYDDDIQGTIISTIEATLWHEVAHIGQFEQQLAQFNINVVLSV